VGHATAAHPLQTQTLDAASAKVNVEEELMRHIATAGPEIERRLGQWLIAKDGLLFVREPADTFEPYALHILPALAPWRASCGEGGLTVTIAAIRKDITEIALDERQCNELLTVLGRTMRNLTATDDRAAPQSNETKSP
jgi:hypothetical protein